MLSVKVALVSVAAALGGFNRFMVLPPLLRELTMSSGEAERGSRSHLANALRMEAVVLLIVVIAAAVLSGLEPPSVR